MSSESPIPRAADRAFGLIETCRWSREHGYAYEAEHMARLEHSAGALGFAFRRAAILQALADFVASLAASPVRVRLVLSRDGSVEITGAPLPGVPAVRYRVAIAGPRHPSGDPWLRHKTTMRDRYEGPLAEAAASLQADEVLFLNERDELCEGARSNLFVRRGDRLLTPLLSCGALPGTLRAHLLAAGAAEEAVLRLSDLADGAEWYMGNSVRDLVPGTLVARHAPVA